LTTLVGPEADRHNPALPHPWRVTAASVPGSKRTSGELGDDAHAWAVEGGWLVAAVADGAGSARRSAEGATLAAAFFVEHFAWALAEEPTVSADRLFDSFEATRVALKRLCRRAGGSLNDFATTLCVAVASDTEVWAAQVGDGAVVVQAAEGYAALASTTRGEFLNETTFLTSPSWRREASVERRSMASPSLALLTDGLGLLALDLASGVPHAPFFGPLFTFCARTDDATGGGTDEGTEGLQRFLRSERVGSRTDDDLTLLIALSWP